MENLNENIGGQIENEFQDWLDMMYTDKDYPEIETLETVIDYAQDTLRDYRADYTVFENKTMENLNEGKKKNGKKSYMMELAEIDAQSAIVAMEAKINKLEEMAVAKEQRLSMVSEDENLSELISKSAVKEMQKEIKEIRKMQEKLKKVYEKKNSKKMPEMVDEEEKVDEMVDPTNMDLDKAVYGDDAERDPMTGNIKEDELDEAHCTTEEDDADSMNEEFLRMQKLAGVISEEEYKSKLNEEVSPQVAAGKALKVADKLEKSPEMDKLAAQVAKNPQMMAQLEKAVKDAGVNVELAEDESGLDMGDLKTMALNLAKKGKKVNEEEDASAAIGGGMAAFFGGGTLGASMGSTIAAAIPAATSVFAGPALVGALAGVGLFILARKAYKMAKGE